MDPGQLARWRRRRGFTQTELAALVGVSANTVARWERGERHIPAMLARVLHLTDENARLVMHTEALDKGRIRKLLQLCHPDRHDNSTAANEATAWLLEQRKRLSD